MLKSGKEKFMQQFSEIWSLTLDVLRQNYSSTIVDLWFTKLILCNITENRAVLICDESYKYGLINSKYKDNIQSALESVLGFPTEVIVVDKKCNPQEYAENVPSSDSYEAVNLADLPQLDAPEIGGEVVTEAAPSYFAAPAAAHPRNQPHHEKNTTQTYQREYTFENFIVGNSNKFAHAASIAVANEPACKANADSFAYNPLFIYGPSGIGKTHLLYAITNHIKKTRPELKILYLKGEDFTNEMIDSIAKKTTSQFRDKYRTADVLCIDDIQFIAGRDSTQEEFFHTFNALWEDHKQIILTSDRPPKDIKTLEDRLKSRFEWGVTADIQPPDADLRAAIIKKKAEQMNISLTADVVNFLAENLKSNIRQVEGAIKKLGALSLLTGSQITVELAKNSIADLMTGGEPISVTIDRIFEKVAKKYGVSVEDIKGVKRTKDIAFARHIAIYMIRKLTDMSLPQLGKLFKRDHTTILSSIKTVEREINANPSMDIELTELAKEIKG